MSTIKQNPEFSRSKLTLIQRQGIVKKKTITIQGRNRKK